MHLGRFTQHTQGYKPWHVAAIAVQANTSGPAGAGRGFACTYHVVPTVLRIAQLQISLRSLKLPTKFAAANSAS
jgi:hypothetical protein